MNDANNDQIGRILAFLMAKKPRNGRAGCPDEEALASYVAGGVTPSMDEQIDVHLAQCTACLDELSAAYSSMLGNEKEAVPDGLLAKAMALMPQKAHEEGFFDIVVRLVRGSVELVSTTGQLIQVPALAGLEASWNRMAPRYCRWKRRWGDLRSPWRWNRLRMSCASSL